MTETEPEIGQERCSIGWGTLAGKPGWNMHECIQTSNHGGPCACHCGAVRLERKAAS